MSVIDNTMLSPPETVNSEHVYSNCPIHTAGHARHDTDMTVLSRLVWQCELSRPDR